MKVSIITLPYHKTHLIHPVFDAIFAQTHKDLEVIVVINDSSDGSKEIIQKDYSAYAEASADRPQVKIIENSINSFTKGVNMGIADSTGEFILMVNDDLILEPNYIEELLRVFENPKVASASGKILRYDFDKNQKTNIIDSVGLVYSSSGRVRDIGQLQVDKGQFDTQEIVWGVSGAAPMHRKSALEKIKFEQEYLDENFIMYWDDGDLSWRFNNAGFINMYVPTAVAYHGRTAGQSGGGYLHLWQFIQHHKKLDKRILRWNYKNHILMYIKNAKHIWHPAFILREIAMLGYIIVFETSTLKVLPELFREIPKILKKRSRTLGSARRGIS